MNRGPTARTSSSHDADYPASSSGCSATPWRRSGVEVHAYCLMTNHFHLLLHCPDRRAVGGDAIDPVPIRAVVQSIATTATAPSSGTVHGPCSIQSDEQLAAVGRYVHRNPLDLRPTRSARGVSLVEFRRRTSARARPPDWLRTDELLAPFGGDLDRFRRFVERRRSGSSHSDGIAWADLARTWKRRSPALFGMLADELRHSRPGAAQRCPIACHHACAVELRAATTGGAGAAIRAEQPIERAGHRPARQGRASLQTRSSLRLTPGSHGSSSVVRAT